MVFTATDGYQKVRTTTAFGCREVTRWILIGMSCFIVYYVFFGDSNGSRVVRNNTKQGKLTVENICVGENWNSCALPMTNFEGEFRFAAKYHLNVCAIPKSISTILTAVVCALHDYGNFRRKNRKIIEELFDNRLCKGKNEVYTIDDLIKHPRSAFDRRNPLEWTHVVVVREPMERFISGFLDRCIIHQTWKQEPNDCYYCKNNLTCFLENLHATMWDDSKIYHTKDNYHYFPQSWWCEMGRYMARNFTIMKFSKENAEPFWREFFELLRAKGVSEDIIQFLNEGVHEGSTSHSTYHMKEEKRKLIQELNKPYHMKLFLKMFYYDYVLFGYPLPNVDLE